MKRRSFIAAAGSLLVAPSTSAQRELGWIAGRNLHLETRLSAGPADIGEIAKELVAARCDLIVVAGTHMALAASRATATIPIVMYVSGWPVEGGLVASYARPGGNITGLFPPTAGARRSGPSS